MTTEKKTPEVGDRVRVVHDIMDGNGRIYLREGFTGIITEIQRPEFLQDDDEPITIQPDAEDWSEEYVDFEDIEVVTLAADVAKEPTIYHVTGTIKVEAVARIPAHSRQEAEEFFTNNGFDILSDNEEMTLKKVKVTDVVDQRGL